jgi:hypothetical protein
MRRTLEAIQAWRRLHDGAFPPRLVDLKIAGLLPFDGAICPDVLHEKSGAHAAHADISSRREGGDPPGTYEYELSASVVKSEDDAPFLPAGTPKYTRHDLKIELLKRPYFEQVPILRCSSHKMSAPKWLSTRDEVFRNITITGSIYWSPLLWEENWLEDVPYCAREANVMFGLKGPPFYTDRAPSLPQALDLRKWSCAFGDHAWWWTFPLFLPRPDFETAANLRPFFNDNHGRAMSLGGQDWWIDGLVQLQGRVIRSEQDQFDGPGCLAFVWKKKGALVNRKISASSCLQGTDWTAAKGEAVGWLVWHYANGTEQRVTMLYGQNTARFWGNPSQVEKERDFPQPVWSHHETKEEAGRERWLRLYQQDWTNPTPEIAVTSVDFLSNSNCRAAPFIIAINVHQ